MLGIERCNAVTGTCRESEDVKVVMGTSPERKGVNAVWRTHSESKESMPQRGEFREIDTTECYDEVY